MKLIFTVLMVAALAGTASAQTQLLHEEVPQTFSKKTGPNRQHYFSLFYTLNAGTSAGGDLDIQPLRSLGVSFGVYYKYKLSGLLSTGFTLGWSTEQWTYRQDAGERFSDSLFPELLNNDIRYEFLSKSAIDPSVFIRINFDPGRGDIKGKYLDIGGWAEYCLSGNYGRRANGANDTRVNYTVQGIPQIRDLHYGVNARLCMNSVGLMASYRLSSYYVPSYAFLPEPGRLRLGFVVML